MSRARVAVLKVVTKELSVTAAAARYGYTRQHLHRLLARYHQGGLEAVDPRSRRPKIEPGSHPRCGPGPDRRAAAPADRPRAWTPARSPSPGTSTTRATDAPSTSTIRRILHAAGLVTPEPRKRPTLLLPALRSRPAQRVLAVRLHPLATGRRHRHRDPQLARRPLPLPARLHRPPPGHRRHRRQELPVTTADQHGLPAVHPDRQRPGLHRPALGGGHERLRVPAGPPRHRPEERPPQPPHRPKARSSASTRP